MNFHYIVQKQISSMDSLKDVLSQKDIQFLKRTFLKVTESYYENPSNQTLCEQLINICSILIQVISLKSQSNSLSLLTALETLKIKAKNSLKLLPYIQKTIAHLKAPIYIQITFQTIIQCLKRQSTFALTCILLIRFYNTIKRNFDWKAIIQQVGSNSSISPTLIIELLNLLCFNNQQHCKQTVRCGFLKYIFSSYLPSILQQKLSLYRTLKLIKTISAAQSMILRDRQKSLALVLFTYQDYEPIIQQVLNRCYDGAYSSQLNYKVNEQGIDMLYLWSFHNIFCRDIITQDIIHQLIRIKSIFSPAIQAKIFAILVNASKYKSISHISLLDKMQMPKHPSSLLQYLKMCLNCVQMDHKQINNIDFNRLAQLSERDNSARSAQLLKRLAEMRDKGNKVGLLSDSCRRMFSNEESVLERAKRVPQNNEELHQISQIIEQAPRTDQFEADILIAAKGKCFESIRTAIVQRKPLDLNSLLLKAELKSVQEVVKLLQLLELQLTMDDNKIQLINEKRVFQFIQWIEDHYEGQIIDWGSIGQLVILLRGQEEWVKHLQTLPKSCFWLLSINQLTQDKEKILFARIDQVFKDKKYQKKHSFLLGILGKALQSKSKIKIITKYKYLIEQIFVNIKNNINFKYNIMMLSMLFKKWHIQQQQFQQANAEYRQIITPILNYIIDHFTFQQQQYYFTQCCLPLSLNADKFLNKVNNLSTVFGSLAQYVYSKGGKQGAVSQLSKCNTGSEMLQCLTFLKKSSELMQSDEVNQLLTPFNKKDIYWHLYPHFTDIVTKCVDVATTTSNPVIQPYKTIEKVLTIANSNEDMIEEEQEQVYQEIKEGIKKMGKNRRYIDIENVRKLVNKIKIQIIKEEITIVLNQYPVDIVLKQESVGEIKKTAVFYKEEEDKLSKIKEEKDIRHQNVKIKQQEYVSKPVHQEEEISSKKYQQFVADKYPNEVQKQKQQVQKQQYKEEQSDRLYSTNKLSLNNKQQIENKQYFQQKSSKQQGRQQLSKSTCPQDQLANIKETQQFMSILRALKRLKQIVDTKEGTQEYPKLYSVFESNKLQKIHRQILGHLLVKFYSLRNEASVLGLLLRREKTELSRQACFQLLSRHKQAFVLAQRWRLLGRDWIDMASLRLTEGFFADACQVMEYNLLKIADTEYFNSKHYPQTLIANFDKAVLLQDRVYYLLLLGTSARLPQVKVKYTQKRMQIKLLQFIKKHPSQLKIIANSSYALSSLVYLQPEICLEIVRQKTEMEVLHRGYRMHCQSRPVVQSGACLIANLAYANEDVKEVLRQQGVVDLLILMLETNLETAQLSTYKQILRAFGNLTLSYKCSTEIIDKQFCMLGRRVAEKINILAEYTEQKARIMKVLIDLIANLAAHKYKLQVMHSERITLLMFTLLQTTESNAYILTGCIDTLDGLCQHPQIERYVVVDKKLPSVLIDILKIQQDQKIILKATRLLTNLTINAGSIPYILKANTLSVLANIVMPALTQASVQQKKKMQHYAYKMISRIFNSNQSLQLILKSGYLDCLIRAIQHSQSSQIYIDILGFYAQHLPTFLNKRAFMSLIRVLTRKRKEQRMVEKCLSIFKVLLTFSIDKDEEDVVMEGVPVMYVQLLRSKREDVLMLLGYHCLRSFKLREMLRNHVEILQLLHALTEKEQYQEIARFDLFVIFNTEGHVLIPHNADTDEVYRAARKGFNCRLYRVDGSWKKAIVAIDEDYNVIAWKYPSGPVKPKYCANVRQIRDFQFCFENESMQWNHSPFTQAKGLFSGGSADAVRCCSIIGSSKWGEYSFINVQFESEEDKSMFYAAFSSSLIAFRG